MLVVDNTPVGALRVVVEGCDLVVLDGFGQTHRVPLSAPVAAEKSDSFKSVTAAAGREAALACAAMAVNGDRVPVDTFCGEAGCPVDVMERFSADMRREYVAKRTAQVACLTGEAKQAAAEVGRLGGKDAVIVLLDMAMGKHHLTPEAMEERFGVPAGTVESAVKAVAGELGCPAPEYLGDDPVSMIREKYGDDIAARLLALVRYAPTFADSNGRSSMEARESLARDAGVSPHTVGQWVTKARKATGFTGFKKGKRVVTEDMEKFRDKVSRAMGSDMFSRFLQYAMYSDASGETILSLADGSGVPASTVRTWAGRYRDLFGLDVETAGKRSLAGLLTGADEMREHVLSVLVDNEGGIRGKKLLGIIRDSVPLTATDLETLPSNSGESRFFKTVYSVVAKMVSDGLVDGRGDRGDGWRLTKAGWDAVSAGRAMVA